MNMRTTLYKVSHIGLLVISVIGASGCGQAGSPCGGATNTLCAPGLYCKLDSGTCDDATATGACTAIPQVCPQIYAPVCGCDDKTYFSACGAASASVNIKHDGACTVGLNTRCGPPDGAACSEGFLCSFDDGMCGTSDQSGQCIAIPASCDNVASSPVCGCDNATYDNECQAHKAGFSVKSSGACPVGGGLNVRCGGADALPCTDGFFCMLATGVCSSNTESGQCVAVPQGCTADATPVCGCDGVTYSNECEALRANVSVKSDGACP